MESLISFVLNICGALGWLPKCSFCIKSIEINCICDWIVVCRFLAFSQHDSTGTIWTSSMINRNEQNQVISLKSALCMTENAWLERKKLFETNPTWIAQRKKNSSWEWKKATVAPIWRYKRSVYNKVRMSHNKSN